MHWTKTLLSSLCHEVHHCQTTQHNKFKMCSSNTAKREHHTHLTSRLINGSTWTSDWNKSTKKTPWGTHAYEALCWNIKLPHCSRNVLFKILASHKSHKTHHPTLSAFPSPLPHRERRKNILTNFFLNRGLFHKPWKMLLFLLISLEALNVLSRVTWTSGTPLFCVAAALNLLVGGGQCGILSILPPSYTPCCIRMGESSRSRSEHKLVPSW